MTQLRAACQTGRRPLRPARSGLAMAALWRTALVLAWAGNFPVQALASAATSGPATGAQPQPAATVAPAPTIAPEALIPASASGRKHHPRRQASPAAAATPRRLVAAPSRVASQPGAAGGLVSFLPGSAAISAAPVSAGRAAPEPAPLRAPGRTVPVAATPAIKPGAGGAVVSFLPGATGLAPAALPRPDAADANPRSASAPAGPGAAPNNTGPGVVSFLPPPVGPNSSPTEVVAPIDAADDGAWDGNAALLGAGVLGLAGLAGWLAWRWRRFAISAAPDRKKPLPGLPVAPETLPKPPSAKLAPATADPLTPDPSAPGPLAPDPLVSVASAPPLSAYAEAVRNAQAGNNVPARAPRFLPIAFPDDEPATPPKPAPPAPCPLLVEFEASRLALTLSQVVLHYHLRLTNAGDRACGPIVVGLDMTGADAAKAPRNLAALDASPPSIRHQWERLPGGGQIDLRGELHLPRSAAATMRLGPAALFVPLVLLRAETIKRPPKLRVDAAFVIGSAPHVLGGGVQPFRLDTGPGIWRQLAVRPAPFAAF